MKKLILVLAILIVAAPAFAPPDVNLVKVGNKVEIRYTGADVNTLLRGIALRIEVGAPGDVCGILNYKIGESNSITGRGYGIYPAKIVIPADFNDANIAWGDPLADQNDPGAVDQILPSQNFILEFGSLYAPVADKNQAPKYPDGNLCTLDVRCNGITNFNIKMTDEDVYRGGVVLENGTTIDVNKTLLYTGCAQEKCFNDNNMTDHNEYNTWVAWKEPNCWCFRRQCRGDADGVKQGLYWVASNDLNILKAAMTKTDTILKGKTNGICADFDHKKQGLYRVASNDLNILKAYMTKTETRVPCCDMNSPPTSPPDCVLIPADKWNFWLTK
jgi:hypothetical protein